MWWFMMGRQSEGIKINISIVLKGKCLSICDIYNSEISNSQAIVWTNSFSGCTINIAERTMSLPREKKPKIPRPPNYLWISKSKVLLCDCLEALEIID